jgi:zinc/manganese transport system substrate-binding protein
MKALSGFHHATNNSRQDAWKCLLYLVWLLLVTAVNTSIAADEHERAMLKVVASFSILGDLTASIGDHDIDLKVLVGADSDAHIYQPTPADSRTLFEADVIIINGLGFEGWINRLITASGTQARIITASDGIEPLYIASANGLEPDPHAWHDVNNIRHYLHNIRVGLAASDPARSHHFTERHAAMQAQLTTLEKEIRVNMARLPADHRTVITNHDAFGYFARAYGLQFISPLGLSTESEASAASVAALIRQIREQEVKAVFMENISDPRLIQQIARESGARIGGTLYSDALSGKDGPAATWLQLFRHNLETLVEALKPVTAH